MLETNRSKFWILCLLTRSYWCQYLRKWLPGYVCERADLRNLIIFPKKHLFRNSSNKPNCRPTDHYFIKRSNPTQVFCFNENSTRFSRTTIFQNNFEQLIMYLDLPNTNADWLCEYLTFLINYLSRRIIVCFSFTVFARRLKIIYSFTATNITTSTLLC